MISRSGNMQMRPMSPVKVMVQLRYVCDGDAAVTLRNAVSGV